MKPIVIDGKEFYLFTIHPKQARDLRRFAAMQKAAEQFAGRNWRRIKREMRKAAERTT